MSVAVSHLQSPNNGQYALPSIRQSYRDYKANFKQLLHNKAEEAIAYKHPRDVIKEKQAIDNQLGSLHGGEPVAELVDQRQTRTMEPVIVSPRLSFEPAKMYYAHPTLVAPVVTSLQYEFLTESQWRAINPYWTKLLKGLTEKLKQELLNINQQKKHFLAYALESTFRGIDFGQSEETIEIRLNDNSNFVCLQEVSDFVKGDILIARQSAYDSVEENVLNRIVPDHSSFHCAIYFGDDKVMASQGNDKSRPRYMDLADFTNQPHLHSFKVYRFTA